MDKKVYELLNAQINKELYSAYLYLDMANFYTSKGLDGFANWFEIQAKEEQDHAMLFYKYLHNNNQAVTLEAVAKPDKLFDSLKSPLTAALEHEEYVTSNICCGQGCAGFPHGTVFGLVHKGTGGGRKEHFRPYNQNGTFRRRPQEPLYA